MTEILKFLKIMRFNWYFNTDICTEKNGEMPERSIGAVSKTVVRLRGPRVRIPVSPQTKQKSHALAGDFFIPPRR